MSEQHQAGDRAASDLRSRLGSDFTTRLVSGLLMGLTAAFFTFAGLIPFTILVVAVTVVLSWEWGRLVHAGAGDAVIAVQIVTVALAAVLAALEKVGLGLVILPIGAILALLLSLGNNSMFSALGVFYAGLPAVALIWLRSDATLGLIAIVFLILIVVVSDTAGFLFGRLIGGARFWPSLSPNKTWAGVLGALAASTLVAAAFGLVLADASPLRLAGIGCLLSLVAQGGDLFESAVKRRFGAKDASTLIPGHGGVMDRVDGLAAVASAAGLLGFCSNVYAPAYALLMGS
ncbi:MAG: phosphatidate cytidylyltransferase [Caulobacteraceae bacterium]|nr:phosphatidate cytidylyltransferase [Caulobacteraceae bacterium]